MKTSNRVGRPVSYNAEVSTNLGYVLGNARVSKGLSQKQVGALIGISLQHLSNIERGVQGLSSKHFERTAQALGISQTRLAGLALQETAMFKRMKKASGV